MPYKKSKLPFEKMKRLLCSYEINAPKLAQALGVTPTTARKKLQQPETLTLKDLKLIQSRLHVEWEEIRKVIGD